MSGAWYSRGVGATSRLRFNLGSRPPYCIYNQQRPAFASAEEAVIYDLFCDV